ncbi:MAG: DUF1574 domain-containing protein [Candidatus Obscuribacterales bacterium]|nr:DUF1574 domain-containing protein [Candidatus Obscuribacterales bacterium]
MPDNSIADKTKKLALRLASSTAVLMVLFFVVVEVVLREVRPLRMLNHTGLTTINQNFLVSKLPPCLSSAENPEVLLLGSSLVLVPSVRCDDTFHGRKTRYDRWYYRNVIDEYTKADFFQDALAKASGKQRNVIDLAVAASMMSDQYLILKKYLDSGKTPRLIVCGVAPRDFLDNLRQDPEKTPTYSILADLTCINDLMESKRSKEAIANFAFGYICDAYKNRRDYSTVLTGLASRTTGHPVDLYQATHEKEKDVDTSTMDLLAEPKEDASVLSAAKPIYEARENRLLDLKEYRRIYLPVNDRVFKLQMGYLEKFLSLAYSKNIPVVLVEMPVTRENLALLPEYVTKRFSNKVKQLSTTYNAKVVTSARDLTFETSDFEDSVHLNDKGGMRLFGFVAGKIGRDRALMARTEINPPGTKVVSAPFKWPF